MAVHVTFPGGQLVGVPVGDDAAMDEVLGGAHLLGGWRFVERAEAMLAANVERNRRALAASSWRPTGRALREAVDAAMPKAVQATLAELDENVPALQAWSAARSRLGHAVHPELEQVEKLARRLALERLDASAAQVKEQAARYLTGFDQAIFAGPRLAFPKTVRLKVGANETTLAGPRDPVADLRAKAHRLARAQAKENAADAFSALAATLAASAGIVVLAVTGIASVRESALRGVRLAAFQDQLAAEHPVLYRMDLPGSMAPGRTTPPSDQELLASVVGALTATWDAQQAVRTGVEALVWASWQERHPQGPAAGLAETLRNRGMKGGIASLLDPAFGPWAFQPVLADAVTDMAGPGPSVVRQAVHDVYQAVDPSLAASFGEAAAITAALLTLHVVAPPVAIVADVVLAIKGILEAILAYLRDRAAYRCALDPAESLGMAPSTLRVALQVAGEVAGALPGGKITTTVSVLAPLTAGFVP